MLADGCVPGVGQGARALVAETGHVVLVPVAAKVVRGAYELIRAAARVVRDVLTTNGHREPNTTCVGVAKRFIVSYMLMSLTVNIRDQRPSRAENRRSGKYKQLQQTGSSSSSKRGHVKSSWSRHAVLAGLKREIDIASLSQRQQ